MSNAPTPNALDSATYGPRITVTSFGGTPEEINDLIARVLCRAHRTADALGEPKAARTILHVAHSFADELAALDPLFDRLQFIRDATLDPS